MGPWAGRGDGVSEWLSRCVTCLQRAGECGADPRREVPTRPVTLSRRRAFCAINDLHLDIGNEQPAQGLYLHCIF